MLGIFLIICMAVYFFIRFKEYCLLKEDFVEEVELDSVGREYEVCHRGAVLRAVSLVVLLVGYLGCVWPYTFVEGCDISAYIICYTMMGIFPVLFIPYACYSIIKKSYGQIKISADEIEYKRYKPFTVKVSDIKKISNRCLWGYEIYLKEKGKKTLYFDVYGFHKRKEICSLITQFRVHSAKLSGRDKKLVHKLSPWKFDAMLNRYFLAFYEIFIGVVILYGCYCCIDYDFFRKDYVAEFNAMGAIAGETENAWPYYVKAATGYVEIEDDFEEIIVDGLKSGRLNLSDEQIGKLRQWYDENRLSWASLKEATSIDYCNATYENISIIDSNDKNDFSNPSDSGYCRIRNLYRNVNACRILGMIDLDWWDMFEMQLGSAKHFAGGKTFIDQCEGYCMLWRSIKFLADKDNYELGDLEKSRRLLKEYFPAGVPVLNIEGDVLVECSSYDSMINFMKIPVQSPLNPAFIMVGPITGTEAYLRKNYATMLEQARNGVEVEEEEFSVMSFPILRKMFFSIFGEDVALNYRCFQRAGTNLSAGYFLLDLEEYRLVKGEYPADVLELGRAGFGSQLPDDVDSGGKIIYLNDGDRAVLYAVGKNGTDDGGYKDGKEVETKRDDVIYWERDLKEEKVQAR